MTITNDMYRSEVMEMPALREGCTFCIALSRDTIAHMSDGFVGFGDCSICLGQGWLHTSNINTNITNINHPFQLVLSNDMMGWMAVIALDGERDGSDSPVFDTPLDAVYAALYRSLEGRKPRQVSPNRGQRTNYLG